MKIVLIGIQGSGKSTQGNILSRQLNIPYLSTGHIFREIAKEKTQLGRYIKETMNAGLLIPDDKTIETVNNYLSRPEYKRGYILDGFPRTLAQAKKFKNNVNKVIYIKIPEKEAVWRLIHRNDMTREDETLPALKKRIELFNRHTKPVLKHYEKEEKLTIIDGMAKIELVNEEILKSIGKQLIKNQVIAWEKKQKTIIAIVGLPGSGKTVAANYFKQKGLPVITFGKVINDYIKDNAMAHNEENHKEVREGLRKKYGKEALALLNKENIKKALLKNLIVVIDGMRSWEEFIYLKKEFKDVRIAIVTLHADKAVRYKRISNREHRRHLYGEDRDINELIGTNMGTTFAFADFFIHHNDTSQELEEKLEIVYRTIYFS